MNIDSSPIAAESITSRVDVKLFFTVSLFAPELLEDGRFQCRVTSTGYYSSDAVTFGADSFEALSAAIRFLNTFLLDRDSAHDGNLRIQDQCLSSWLFANWGFHAQSIDYFQNEVLRGNQ